MEWSGNRYNLSKIIQKTFAGLFVYSDANSEVRVWDVLPMTLSVSDPLTHNPTHNRKLLDGSNGTARKQMLLILGYKPSNGAENGR